MNLDHYEWRYMPTGHVKHALISGSHRCALCGTEPHGLSWHGTGSQTEYERAAGLPRCKRCCREAGRR